MALRRSLNILRRELGVQFQAAPRRHGSSIPGSSTSGLLWLFPLGFGGYYGYSSWTETIKDPWEKHKAISSGDLEPPRTAYMGEILLYKVLPLRSLSRLWGFVNDLSLHPSLRGPLLGLYARTFGCNMEEAEDERLENYPNLGALFRRALKEGARPVDENAMIVSPADGHVIWFGEVSSDGELEQVKGVNYSLDKFLGLEPAEPKSFRPKDVVVSAPSPSSLMRDPEKNSLYHCLIYLAPGDYHRYHSPADWTVEKRTHFPGELFSVSPGVTRWLKGLFNYNERVVYSGSWEHGFFSYAPVGATNVGSIKAYFDPSLETNLSRRQKKAITNGSNYDGRLSFPSPIAVGKGAPFGEFNLGSSIVLIFEAPKNFEFHLTPGQKILCGSYLGGLEVKEPEAMIAAPVVESLEVVEVALDLEEANVCANAEVVEDELAPASAEDVVTAPVIDPPAETLGVPEAIPGSAPENLVDVPSDVLVDAAVVSETIEIEDLIVKDTHCLADSALDVFELRKDIGAKEEVIEPKPELIENEEIRSQVDDVILDSSTEDVIDMPKDSPVVANDAEEETASVITTPAENLPQLA